MIRKAMIVAAAFGLMASQPLMAQTTPSGMGHPHMMVMGGGMHGGGAGMLMLLRSANLTPAQQSQVRQIVASSQSQMQALHGQMEALHRQIADKLLAPGQVSVADVRPLVQKMTGVEAQLTESMTTTAIAVRNVLTQEQLKQLAQVHRKLRDLHTQVQRLMGTEQNIPDTDE
jgi:Spy/CpxP family protein refolding chaperone